MGKIDYIVEEANKLIAPPIPDGAIYIRKKNTDCFLSIENSASSEGYLTKYVTKSENPQSWILVTTNNGQEIVKSDDTSFKLVVSEDGNRVMLNNSTLSSHALLVSDTSDSYKIGPNTSNARTTASRLGVYGDDLYLRTIGHDTFETVTYVNAPLTSTVSSSTPAELKDKYFRIKQNGKYLTKNSNSNIVSLSDTKADDSSQIWKVSTFENHPVIISRSDETLALSINPLRNDCNISDYESFKLHTALTFESAGESDKYYIKASNFANKYLKYVTSIDLDVPAPASEVTGNYVMWEDFDTDVCTWEFEEHINYLTYPCKYMRIVQRHDGTYSHAGNQLGSVIDYPIDEGCEDGSRSMMYCPCDEMEVLRVRGVDYATDENGNYIFDENGNHLPGLDEPGKANVIWLKSTSKVVMPFGEDSIVLMVIHPNDDDLKNIKVGQKFLRGQEMFREGSDAGSGTVSNHFHFSVSTGNIKESNSGLGEYQSTYLSPENNTTSS